MPFLVAPLAVALMARVRARFLMAGSLAAIGGGLLLMSGLTASDGWTALLPGFIVAGIGVGLLNPVIADVAVSVVSKERSGMAAGINDTFRQVAIAVGVAAWGAIFLGRGADKIAALTAGTPAATGDRPRQLIEAASGGQLGAALQAVPRGARALVAERHPPRVPQRPQHDPRDRRRCWRSPGRCSPSGSSASTRSSARRSRS